MLLVDGRALDKRRAQLLRSPPGSGLGIGTEAGLGIGIRDTRLKFEIRDTRFGFEMREWDR